MTPNEAEFHQRLTRALGPGQELFPQIPILALLEPQDRRGTTAFRKAFGRVSNRRVDWIVSDRGRTTVVELDDRTHDAGKDRERDRILASCGYRVIRYDSRQKPSVDRIRTDLAQS